MVTWLALPSRVPAYDLSWHRVRRLVLKDHALDIDAVVDGVVLVHVRVARLLRISELVCDLRIKDELAERWSC